MWPHANSGLVCGILSPLSRLLHRLHVSSPEGALTPGHASAPSNLHQGIVFTRASRGDHFLEQLFEYWGGGGVQSRIPAFQILYKNCVRNLFGVFKDLCG